MLFKGYKILIGLFFLSGLISVLNAQNDSIAVSGKIYDAGGNALDGIRVTVPGVGSALSRDSGEFHINVPAKDITISIEGIGYQAKEIALKGRTDLKVILNEDEFSSVYDPIITSVGEKPKIYTVNATTEVNRNDYEISNSADELLLGSTASVNVIPRSGDPGLGSNIFIRGYQTLLSNTQPFIVVDGVPFETIDNSQSYISGNVYNNLLLHIDTRDIESITIFKDGSSGFGYKGANGVIMINTNRPQQLATEIDFYSHGGIYFKPKYLPVMDAVNYRIYMTDQLQTTDNDIYNVYESDVFSGDMTNSNYYRYHNQTDWQDEVFNTGVEQNYYLKVSGGDDRGKMAVSVGYLNRKGIIRNTDLDRYSMRINNNINVSKRLVFSLNLSFLVNNKELKGSGINSQFSPIYMGLAKGPIFAPYINNELGTTPNLEDVDPLGISNPTAIINNMDGNVQNKRFFGILGFDYELSPKFTVGSTFNINFSEKREIFFMPDIGVVPTYLNNGLAYNIVTNLVDRLFVLYNDTKVKYTNINNPVHNIEAVAGFRFNTTNIEIDWGKGYNTPSDEVRTLESGSSLLQRTGGDIMGWSDLTYYFSGEYNMLNKYFVSTDLSLYGSSRFGSEANGLKLFGTTFGLFPSVQAGWLISSEEFMGDLDFIDVLKIRLGFGINGNDFLSNRADKKYYDSQRYIGVVGTIYSSIPNSHIQWETVSKTNIGLDFSIFNERLGIFGDYYMNKTSNMLVLSPASVISGQEYFLTNDGAMKSNGYEVGMNTRIVNSEIKWDFGMAVAHYDNEITELPTDEYVVDIANGFSKVELNQPLGNFYGYKTNGVYASDEEALASGLMNRLPSGELVNFRGGDVRFVDGENGDNIIDSDDRQIIGNASPDLTGYFNSSVKWKNVSFELLFTYSLGNDIYNTVREQMESMKNTDNQFITAANRWRYDGQITDMPRAEYSDPMGNSRFSDRWIEDGSYIKLKSLTLSYDIPVKSEFFRSVLVYYTANNLITLTRYLGYDPEFSNSIYSTSQGVDMGLTPVTRSMFFGIKVGL